MQKVVRDGNVAVIYSPGYGAGWYSWNQEFPELMFHPILVEYIEQGRHDELTSGFVKETLGIKDDYVYLVPHSLAIEWVPEGTRFEISEYDGNEHVRILEPSVGFVA